MTAICPHCGFDLAKDEPIAAGRFRYDPRGGMFADDVRLPLTPKELQLAGALFRARGRIVPYEALIDRMELRDRLVISVHVRRIRAKFEKAGLFNPVGTAWGLGLFWGGEPFSGGARA